MNTKVTLQFTREVSKKSKIFALNNNVSLSQLVEFLCREITSGNNQTMKKFPVIDWVNQIAEGEAIYKKQKRKDTLNEFFNQTKRT